MIERIDIMSLPEPAEWSAGFRTPVRAPNYSFMRGGLTHALGFGRFFWPEFIQVKGCIVNVDRYSESYFAQCERVFDHDKKSIERNLNQVDMETIYTIAGGEMPEDVIDQALDELAHIIVNSWRCAAKSQWPDLEFITGIVEINAPPSVWISTA